ncbi:LysR family transcriptional regulator [Sphingomonas flavalba]|uniref:LysR family transcriptional regulator n=1 Tax=Sphingomonas flavalba TaxID=2559804 RepID=UPI0039E1505F
MLLTLSVLLQTRSVTGTARKLGVSQPAVSRSLTQLRIAFQDPLLIRTNRGMDLTSRGEELVAPVQNWLATTSLLFTSSRFDPAKLQRTFRIASTDHGVLSVIAPALRELQQLAPEAVLEVSAFSDTMNAKLASGELDLIVTGIEPDFSATYGRHLFEESCSCVMRAGHPALAGHDDGAMAIDNFLQWPHISVTVSEYGPDPVSAMLNDHAAYRKVRARLPYFQISPFMLLDSDAVVTLPTQTAHTFAADERFAVIPAPVEIGRFNYWVLWHERSRRDPATMWLVDVIADACTASQPEAVQRTP